MTVTTATAPGKVILFGEHAVVYGRPAIAVPVTRVRATATVADSDEAGVHLHAPDLGRDYSLSGASEEDPLAEAIRIVAGTAGISTMPDLSITLQSTIPMASGLGSGAAMAAAVVRALANHLGRPDLASNEAVSSLTYEVEKLLHGTPSGIDNTVVSYEQPVYFIRRQPANLIETLTVAVPLRLLVADTGVTSATRAVVGDVRRQWEAEPEKFESLFDGCGQAAEAARHCIENGETSRLGQLMSENQELLRQMTVSSPELEKLIAVAKSAGALGAKLSGAGRGGNMVALVDEETSAEVARALLDAGARTVISSTLS